MGWVRFIFLQSMMTLAVIMGGGILHKNETHPHGIGELKVSG